MQSSTLCGGCEILRTEAYWSAPRTETAALTSSCSWDPRPRLRTSAPGIHRGSRSDRVLVAGYVSDLVDARFRRGLNCWARTPDRLFGTFGCDLGHCHLIRDAGFFNKSCGAEITANGWLIEMPLEDGLRFWKRGLQTLVFKAGCCCE